MDASASGFRQLSAGARIEILGFFLKKAFKSFLVAPGGCSREWFSVAIHWDRGWNINIFFKKKGIHIYNLVWIPYLFVYSTIFKYFLCSFMFLSKA